MTDSPPRRCLQRQLLTGLWPRPALVALVCFAWGQEAAAVDVAPPARTEALAAARHVPLPELDDEISLEDCLKYAVLNNHGLRAAHHRWQAAMAMLPQARSLPDPRLSYSYYVQEVETRVGPQRQSLALTQMFPWFGKVRLQGDAAAKAAEAAWLEFQAQKLELAYRVSGLYHDLCLLQETIDVNQSSFDLLRSLEAVARERYRTGEALTAVMQVQVELGKLEDRLRSLRELRAPMVARLNAALSREPDAALPWPLPPPKEMPELDPNALLGQMRDGNPNLARLEAMSEKERLAAELARKNGFPDMTLGVSFIDTRDAVMPVDDSGKDPVMATVSINLPIWRGKYRAQWREAKSREAALQEEMKNRTNTLAADLKLALYYYEDAGRQVGLYRDTLLPKAEQSLGVARQAFQAGKADFLAVVDAQRTLLEFRLAEAKARTEQGKRLAEIRMLAGIGARPPEPEPSPE